MPKARRTRPGLEVVTRPGSSALYLRGTVRGQRIYESTGTDSQALAEEARAAREAELYRSAVHGTKPTVAFAAAVVSYLEHEARSEATKTAIAKLLRHFGPKIACDQIDQSSIDKAGRAICPGSKPATVLRQVTAPVRAVLNHAARRGWTAPPMFEKVRGGGKRTEWLTPAEAEAMVAGASAYFRPTLIFLLGTGARVGEMVNLEWADVDLQNARAVLRETKNGDDRIVDLPPRVVAAMAGLPGDRIGRVFRPRNGAAYRSTDDGKTGAYGGQIKRAWATALSKGGITRHLTPHHARHTWATWQYLIHANPMKLREDGGWRSISQVERYAKLAPEGMKADALAFLGIRDTRSVQVIAERRASA